MSSHQLSSWKHDSFISVGFSPHLTITNHCTNTIMYWNHNAPHSLRDIYISRNTRAPDKSQGETFCHKTFQRKPPKTICKKKKYIVDWGEPFDTLGRPFDNLDVTFITPKAARPRWPEHINKGNIKNTKMHGLPPQGATKELWHVFATMSLRFKSTLSL